MVILEGSSPENPHDVGMDVSANQTLERTERTYPQFDVSNIPDSAVRHFAELAQRTPLPLPDQTAMLIQQKQQAAVASEHLQANTVIPEAEKTVMEGEVAHGELAREQLMQSHAYLVMEFALKYADKGVPLAELVHQGNAALMRAIERHTLNRKQEFAAVAIWFIRQGMTQLIAEQSVKASPEKSVVTPDTSVHRLLQLHPEAVTALTLRELQIMKLRYGLEDLVWRSFEAVGKELGISPEEVRQIDAEALIKLRALPFSSEEQQK